MGVREDAQAGIEEVSMLECVCTGRSQLIFLGWYCISVSLYSGGVGLITQVYGMSCARVGSRKENKHKN